MTMSKPTVLKGHSGAVIEVGIGVGLKETSKGFLSGKLGAMSGCLVGRSVFGERLYSAVARTFASDEAMLSRMKSWAPFLLFLVQLKMCLPMMSWVLLQSHTRLSS